MSELYGPNVVKLITRFAATEAIHIGIDGKKGFLGAVEFFQNTDYRKKILQIAEAKAIKSLEVIKSAPDNPYGDNDELIAFMLLERISQRDGGRKV